MPKIIKIYTLIELERFAPAYFWSHRRPWFFYGRPDYHALADNGEMFLIEGDSNRKDWHAFRCLSHSLVDTTNFWLMHLTSVPTGEVSQTFESKNCLINALENEIAEFRNDEKKRFEASLNDFKELEKKHFLESPYKLISNTELSTEEDFQEFGRLILLGLDNELSCNNDDMGQCINSRFEEFRSLSPSKKIFPSVLGVKKITARPLLSHWAFWIAWLGIWLIMPDFFKALVLFAPLFYWICSNYLVK